MRFSVIVPIYKVEKYLNKCLDSIIRQTYQDFELILVDDGSPDRCGMICDEYAAMDQRIHVYHQDNQGLSAARNTGLDHASGEWVIFVDSDDWIEPDYFAVLSKQIDKYPADIYCINFQKIDESGSHLLEKKLFFLENDQICIDTEKERFLLYVNSLMQYKLGWEAWSHIFKMDIIKRENLRFEPTKIIFAEDYLFCLEYFLQVKQIRCICNILYNYRIRSDSLMGKNDLSTTLQRIFQLCFSFFRYVKCRKYKCFLKNFYEIYFHLMNYQIQYTLKDVSVTEMEQWLSELPNLGISRMWMRRLSKRAEQYSKYMVNYKWI